MSVLFVPLAQFAFVGFIAIKRAAEAGRFQPGVKPRQKGEETKQEEGDDKLFIASASLKERYGPRN